MTEQLDDRPKWLLELENRRRKTRLAHEAGAGAPCLSCTSACPGLELHFWRKICMQCKCSRDDHDVDDNDFPQFELLFGPSSKSKNRPTRLCINKKNVVKETTFEWVPPGATKELAADYMKSLPEEKQPIEGSVGAALRKQQLQKQLPLHDIDHKACSELNDQEIKEFERYLENLKSFAGQGRVAQFMAARPFHRSFLTPANATDVQRFSPQHQSTPNQSLNLRTPSSFLPKLSPPLLRTDDSNFVIQSTLVSSQIPNLECQAESNVTPGRYHRTVAKVGQESNIAKVDPSKAMQKSPQFSSNLRRLGKGLSENGKEHNLEKFGAPILNVETSREAEILAEEMLSEALLPPSAVNAVDIVGSTLDQKGLMFIRDKLSCKYGNAQEELVKTAVLQNPSNKDTPKGQPSYTSHLERESILPVESFLENKPRKPIQFAREIGPKLKSEPSEDSKTRPLHVEIDTLHNVPSNVIHSEELRIPIFPEQPVSSNEELQQYPNAVNEMQENMEALTVNSTEKQKCHECQGTVNVGDVVVTVEKAKDAVWHPGCFVCSACNELLADLVYFYHKGKLYCGRDVANLLGIPRCYACDELIFVRKYTVAEGHSYHLHHFCCWDCDKPLAGQQYTPENDRPLCLSCYQSNYAKICAACKKAIAADLQAVTVKELDFHATDECFCCYQCRKSLFNGKIGKHGNKLFCSKECIAEFSTSNV